MPKPLRSVPTWAAFLLTAAAVPACAETLVVDLQNHSQATWTLKAAPSPTVALALYEAPRPAVPGLPPAASGQLPCRVEGGRPKDGYWDLKPGGSYKVTLTRASSTAPFVGFFHVGGLNRNYVTIRVTTPRSLHLPDWSSDVALDHYESPNFGGRAFTVPRPDDVVKLTAAGGLSIEKDAYLFTAKP